VNCWAREIFCNTSGRVQVVRQRVVGGCRLITNPTPEFLEFWWFSESRWFGVCLESEARDAELHHVRVENADID
jgi:hypothetical protein